VPHAYALFDLVVRTPRLELRSATDDLLEQLVPHVVAGVFDPDGPPPFDDPMSMYDDSPQREWRWLRAIWAGRARVDPDEWWRLYFAVIVDGQPVGMQDLTGISFREQRTVATFSWLAREHQGVGIGKEMRAAVLHLAFAGLRAERAQSEAFEDNDASNRISVSLGYTPEGTRWATRRGEPARMIRYELTRARWFENRRDDIEVSGIERCLPVLGL
jgi:RimJ/RimL family protein N-acetyltransferase